ncbi:cyclin-domain-containing protein [Cunninghamella echinulata]|nr:cyclin-domain-containing protein [Cunninghamella echinulata]
MSKQITPDDHSTPNISVIEVPEYFYAVDINYLSHMIADMLGRLISHNDLIPLTPSNLTRFHSRIPPNISLVDYLRRIIKFTSIEKSCLLIILIYIDRVCERHPQFTISSLTVHRFLITAVTVSSKALSDSYCTNSHYARIGGISTQELNALELEFLSLIDWHLASTGVILQRYYTNLVAQHPCYHRILSNNHTITMIDHVTSSSSISTSNQQHSTSSTTSSSLSSSPTSSTTSISPNNNIHKSKKRRRQSSIISTNDLQNLQQQQEGINNNKDSSGINNNNNNNNNSEDNHEQNENDEEADDEEEEEERRIWAHFDQLSNIEWIPYIA